MRFQTMAPRRPASTTSRDTMDRSIMPDPMVLATCVPRTKAATKLKKAAQSTATWGVSTRVETTVAMELAASWKPFRKSKVSATRMMKTMKAVSFVIVGSPLALWLRAGSGVLDHDVAEDVGVVLAAIAGLFEAVVDLLPLQDLDGVAAIGLEEVGDHRAVEGVSLVLE